MRRHARIAVPGDPYAVALARERVLTQIGAWGTQLSEETHEAVRLVASELITNAVVHVGGLISVGLYLDEDWLLLVVYDSDHKLPMRQPGADDAEAGRGLLLVAAVASDSGWEETERGKKVWAAFTVPPTVRRDDRDGSVRRSARAARLHRDLLVIPHGLALAGAQ